MTTARKDPTLATMDLLRRRRGWAGQLHQFAAHLAPSEQALIEAIYDRGMSASEFARALEQRPRSVRRRVHRIVQRMLSPSFRYVLMHRHTWPTLRRQIAESIILAGRSQRETAARLRVTVHQVRRELDRVRILASETNDRTTQVA